MKKLNRRQLRKLIAEAMFDPRTAFKGAKDRFAADTDDDVKQRTFSLADSPNVKSQRQGHNLIDIMGDYDSPSGDSYLDISSHDEASKLAAFENALDRIFGDDKNYLDQSFKENLFSIFDQNAKLSGSRGFRFGTPEKSSILSTDMLYGAAMNIFKKDPNASLNYHEWNDSLTKVLESLVVKIIMLARVTHFDADDLEESGLGDYSGPEKIYLWNEEFKNVVNSGKLVVLNPHTQRPMMPA
jgi:hypothetical protein